MNQSTAVPLAQARMEDALVDGIRTVARQLLFAVPRLTESDRQFLWDLNRGEARFPFRGVQRLIGISRACPTPEVREALAEVIRREIVAGTAPASVPEAFGLEVRSTGPADVAQREYERHPCPATRAAAIEALERQLIATRLALAALYAGA